MNRKIKTTNYIFALVVLYFGAPSLIWGLNGFMGAVLVVAIAGFLAALWGSIYLVVTDDADWPVPSVAVAYRIREQKTKKAGEDRG